MGMLSCRGKSGATKKNKSQPLPDDLPEKNENIKFSKHVPNVIEREKMGNVFLTKRNGKVTHIKRNQTTREYEDANSIPEKADTKLQNSAKKHRLKKDPFIHIYRIHIYQK